MSDHDHERAAVVPTPPRRPEHDGFIWSVLFVAGVGLVVGGVWWIYAPAGAIVAGLSLIVLAVLGDRQWGG